MTIVEDILALEQKQKDFKASKGRYIQGVATPEIIPKKGDKTTFVKLNKPHDETDEIDFEPKERDYQFKVDKWTKRVGGVSADGYVITALRDLGDGVIEVVTKASE